MKVIKILCLLITLTASASAQHFGSEKIQIDAALELNSIERFTVIDLPYDSHLHGLRFVENDVIAIDLKERYNIKTYDIYQGTTIVGKCTWNENGVHYSFIFHGESLSIYPEIGGTAGTHIKEWGIEHEHDHSLCGHVPTSPMAETMAEQLRNKSQAQIRQEIQEFGDRIRTYRMAVTTTGEFYQLNGGNDSDVTAVATASVQGLSLLYERELSVRFNLSRFNMFKDAATDPFTPDEQGGDSRPRQAGRVIDDLWTSNLYDIGHVLHKSVTDDGWSSGGVALLSSSCNDNTVGGHTAKAQGWSGSFSNSGFSWISLFGHEIGHQFSATHTFNASGEACQDNISATTAYEIGSGTTIMSYNGLCGDGQNIPASGEADNYFHIESLKQMINHINNFDCASSVNSNNALPEVNANPCGAQNNIPKRTPFYLKGSGTDADGDQLTYTWEQVDEDGPGSPTQGAIGLNAANSTLQAPLFRSYPPSVRNDRFIPRRDIIEDGIFSDPYEALPNRSRTIEFLFTARDNHSGGTAIDYDNLTINVTNDGPFVVDNPSALTVGESATISWSTNGSDDLCELVSIRLSVDGGKTYPYLLAEDVPYGSETYEFTVSGVIPKTNSARLMITCEDYDCFKFFNVNTSNFQVDNPDCDIVQSLLCRESDLYGERGSDDLVVDNLSVYTGTRVTSKNFITNTSSPPINLVTTNAAHTSCSTFSPQGDYEYFDVALMETDNYNIISEGLFFTMHDLETFEQDNLCSSYIYSNTIFGGGSITGKSVNSVDLEACKPMRVIANLNPGTLFFGRPVIALSGNQPEKIYYFVVDQADDIVKAVLTESDFRNIGGGEYTVYGVNATMETDLASYVGQPFGQYYEDGDCFRITSNSFSLTVTQDCVLGDVTLGDASECDPATTTYTMPVTLSYSNTEPGTEIMINGESYSITSSPQTISLELPADGMNTTIEVFLSTEPDCIYSFNVQNLDPCCPFDVDLGDDITLCSGESTMVSSNVRGDEYTYEWLLNNMVIATTPDVDLNAAGVYTLNVTNASNCTDSDDIEISIIEPPSVTVIDQVQLCEGEESVIIATSGATIFRWYLNNELVQEGTSSSYVVSETGILRVEVGEGSCTASAITTITGITPPMPDLGGDKVGCLGTEITLSIDEELTSTVWWKDGVGFDGDVTEVTVSESGVYVVTVDETTTCVGTDTITVTFLESPTLNLPAEESFCDGGSIVLNTQSGATDFVWSRNGTEIPGEEESTLEVTSAGEYSVIASFDGSCETTAMTVITEIDNPVFDLGDDVTECEYEEVNVEGPEGDFTYSWTSGSTVVSEGRSYTPELSGTYTLTVTDENECQGSDAIDVNLLEAPSFTLSSSEASLCENEMSTISIITDADDIKWSLNGSEIQDETDESINIVGGGAYTVNLIGSNTCVLDTAITIENLEAPTVDLGGNQQACLGETVELSSSNAAATHEWVFNNAVIATTPSITVTQAGTYKLVDTNTNGCSDEDEIVVTFIDPPTLTIDPSFTYCEGLSTNIEAASNATEFQWFINNQPISGESSSSLEVNTAGEYRVIALQGMCTSIATFTVSEEASPDIDLGDDAKICPGESIMFTAGAADLNYTWNVSAEGNSYELLNENVTSRETRTIMVEATNEFNCTSMDTALVELVPVVDAAVDISQDFICFGDSLTIKGSGGDNLDWSGESFDRISDNTIVVYPDTTTIYTLRVSNECPDNVDSENFQIQVRDAGSMTAGRDTCVLEGNTIVLKAEGGVDYDWASDPSILTDLDVANIEVAPEEETTYTVNITDINGCTLEDAVTVCIILDPANIIKAISVITPNGDNLNDELYFEGLELFNNNELSIYNRWGDLIFQQRDYQRQGLLFNGDDGGDEIPTDTYYYILKFDDYTIKSTLTIVREK